METKVNNNENKLHSYSSVSYTLFFNTFLLKLVIYFCFTIFRGRGIAGGVCAAIFYVLAFLVSKTWVNLIDLVALEGCFFTYGILSFFGVIYVYFYLPETEGKTLAEIEKYFTKKP